MNREGGEEYPLLLMYSDMGRIYNFKVYGRYTDLPRIWNYSLYYMQCNTEFPTRLHGIKISNMDIFET
jgi:hypothetical protein